MQARRAGLLGVAAALVASAIALTRHPPRGDRPALESIHAIRVTRHDRFGLPEKKGAIRDPARVRSVVAALGIDGHPGGTCLPDYSTADYGLVLSGSDVYVRRDVYLFDFLARTDPDASADADGGAPRHPYAVTATSAGCRVGAIADPEVLAGELRLASPLP